MLKIIFLLFAYLFSYADTILVASSANTSYAMPEIIKAFKKVSPKTNVKLILASSGKLTAQIMHGAPYDVFLSANMKYPRVLYKRGFAKTPPVVYAKGGLALFSVKNIDLSDFKKALLNAKLIAVANPKTAPYGQATLEAFKNAGVYGKIKNKLIYSESVTGVIPYTINEADIGVVAKSSLYSDKMKKFKNFKDVPEQLYTPIKQGIVILNDKDSAKRFYEFILSKKAKDIFKKYGYVE